MLFIIAMSAYFWVVAYKNKIVAIFIL